MSQTYARRCPSDPPRAFGAFCCLCHNVTDLCKTLFVRPPRAFGALRAFRVFVCFFPTPMQAVVRPTPLVLLVLFVLFVLFCRYYKLVTPLVLLVLFVLFVAATVQSTLNYSTPLVLLVLFVLFRRYYGSAHTQLHHPLLLFVLFIASTVLSKLTYSTPSCFRCFFVATTFLSTLNYSTPLVLLVLFVLFCRY